MSGIIAGSVIIRMSSLALVGIGATVTLFTGKPVLYSGLRIMIFGLIAAALTFVIGSLIGVSLGG